MTANEGTYIRMQYKMLLGHSVFIPAFRNTFCVVVYGQLLAGSWPTKPPQASASPSRSAEPPESRPCPLPCPRPSLTTSPTTAMRRAARRGAGPLDPARLTIPARTRRASSATTRKSGSGCERSGYAGVDEFRGEQSEVTPQYVRPQDDVRPDMDTDANTLIPDFTFGMGFPGLKVIMIFR